MKNYLLFLLLLVQITSFGQVKLSDDFKVTVGTPYRVEDARLKDYFADGKGQAVAIKTEDEKVTIQRIDIHSLKETSKKAYEDFPPYTKVQKILQAGDKLFYVYSSFNKKLKNEDIYSREVKMATGTFESPKLLFSTADEVTVSSYIELAQGVSMFGLGAAVRFEVHKSFDNSKILIRYRLKPEERDDSKNYDKLGFYVFNTNLEKLWGGEVKMPYTEKQINNLAYGVSKEGKAYMLAYINASNQFELLTISSDLKVKPNKIDIDGDLVFQQLQLKEAVDGTFSCTGYYANGVKWNAIGAGPAAMTSSMAGAILNFDTNGILYFNMDTNGKVLHKYNFEFPLALINEYESNRAKKRNERKEGKGKAGIRNLLMTDVVLDADGSTIIVGEQQFVIRSYSSTGTGMSSNSSTYVYGDVVATKFDKIGNLIWMKKLPKTQEGRQGRGGMGIRFIKGKGFSYILYLDNVKNAQLSIAEVPDVHQDGRGGYLTAYKINDANGKIEKHTIFNINDIQGTDAHQFKTQRIFDGQDNVFLLETYIKGKEDVIIKMELSK